MPLLFSLDGDDPAVVRMCGEPAVGEQVGEGFGGGFVWEPLEEVAQIGPGFDVVGFATGDQGHWRCGAMARADTADEQPRLAAQGDWLDRTLTPK